MAWPMPGCLDAWLEWSEQKRSEAVRGLLAQCDRYRAALDELARIGNGGRYGNSEGNQIAQRALGLSPAEVYNHTQA